MTDELRREVEDKVREYMAFGWDLASEKELKGIQKEYESLCDEFVQFILTLIRKREIKRELTGRMLEILWLNVKGLVTDEFYKKRQSELVQQLKEVSDD